MGQSEVKQTYATGELGLPSKYFFFFKKKKWALEKEQSRLANMVQGCERSSKRGRHAAV